MHLRTHHFSLTIQIHNLSNNHLSDFMVIVTVTHSQVVIKLGCSLVIDSFFMDFLNTINFETADSHETNFILHCWKYCWITIAIIIIIIIEIMLKIKPLLLSYFMNL